MVLLRRLSDSLETIALSLQAGERLLDFGCAEKPYRDLFERRFDHYLGCDIPGNQMADFFVAGDGTLPVKDDCFDCVLSTQVLEHVIDPDRYLSEALRILKPGGHLVLSTHGIYNEHPDPGDYWRWTFDGLRIQVARVGFRVLEMRRVLRLLSTSLLLFEKATGAALPRWLRPMYYWIMQTVIGLAERIPWGRETTNATVYVVLARKPDNTSKVTSREFG